MAKETARENNDEAIKKSVDYYNTKVKVVEFKEGELVLLKIHNFLGKNRKLAETFKGPFVITKVNDNGTIKIRTKYGQHEQLVNQNQLVKYEQPENITKPAPEKEKEEEPKVKRTYQKKVYPGREDGGPITRSKISPIENGGPITQSKINPIENSIKKGGASEFCKHTEKINLITSEQLKDPSQIFGKLIKNINSKEALEKRLQLANFSKNIIRRLNSEQLTALQDSLKNEASLWKQSFKFIQK
jgi:hypothetical protein